MKKDISHYQHSKTNFVYLIVLVAALMAALSLLNSLFNKNGPVDQQNSNNVVLTNDSQKQTDYEMVDLLLNQDSLFDSCGCVCFDQSSGDRFNYSCFSSLCVTRRHCFDEETSYAEFYVDGYQTLTGTLFIDQNSDVYDGGRVTCAGASILIYADGRLIKSFTGDFNIKTRAQSFELDIANTEFLKIVFNNCYSVDTGMYDPSVILGDLIVRK